jgi:hypothetical protein
MLFAAAFNNSACFACCCCLLLLMHCHLALTTLCGLLVAAPSLVMLMDDVLDARMVCTDVTCNTDVSEMRLTRTAYM